jgi:hypothetical protein
MSGFPEFVNMSKDSSDDEWSPRFLLDWSQIPLGYDSMIQSNLMLDLELNLLSQLTPTRTAR